MLLKGDYFDNAFTLSSKPNETISKINPSNTDQVLWEANVDYSHIQKVIDSASAGYKKWRTISTEERISFLKAYKEEVLKRKEDIAKAISTEVGKPYWEALTEAGAIAAKVDVTINDSLKRIQTKTIENVLPNLNGHTIHRPLGVTLIIGPYNFPCHLANGQILSALLAGNSIIFKPSEKTIYSGQILIECFHAAQLPKGTINFINGSVHTSSELAKHPAVKGIFFTGSHFVGLKILENTYQDLTKMVALELGGRNSTILHEDTDIDHALAELMRSCYLTTGQRCSSTSIILVHDKIVDEFTKRFQEQVKRIKVGKPFNEDKVFMGPLVDEQAQKLYLEFHQFALDHGAKTLVEPKSIDLTKEGEKPGYYVTPSLHYIEKISAESNFFKEEIFGPQATIIPYSNLDEAISLANATPYGLASAIFTQDKSIYEKCLRDLEAGIINLNRSTVGASSRLPFGGVKNSGNFRPAAVSMIDHCVTTHSSLETFTGGSKLEDIVGLK